MAGVEHGATRARTAGGQGTVQGRAVLAALGTSPRFRTAQHLFSKLRADGSVVGLTTVYRNLRRLADEGAIHAVQLPDRQVAYRLCSDDVPHHHLVCMQCGAGVEIKSPEIEELVVDIAASRGYSEVNHRMEIFGLCPACSDRGDAPAHSSKDSGAPVTGAPKRHKPNTATSKKAGRK